MIFQCPATDYAESLIILHNYLMMFLSGIGIFVTVILVYVVDKCKYKQIYTFDHNMRLLYSVLSVFPLAFREKIENLGFFNKLRDFMLIFSLYKPLFIASKINDEMFSLNSLQESFLIDIDKNNLVTSYKTDLYGLSFDSNIFESKTFNKDYSKNESALDVHFFYSL